MMRVTVEIWPGGNSLRPRQLAVINIANASRLATVSDYAVDVNLNPGRYDEVYKRLTITKHRRSLGWAVLIERIVRQVKELTRLEETE